MAITQFEKEREGKEREKKKSIDVRPDLTNIYAPPIEKEDTETH